MGFLCHLRVRSARSLAGTVAHLSALVSLETVDLRGCAHLTGEFSSFSALRGLRRLDLSDTRVGGELSALADCPLVELQLFECGDLRGSLADARLPATLVKLRLKCRGRPAQLTGCFRDLKSLKRLKTLVIQNAHGLVGSLAPLAKFTRLAELDLHGCRSLEGPLAPLAKLVALTDLDLSGTAMHPMSLSGSLYPLEALNRLRSLNLAHCPALLGKTSALAHLPILHRANFRGCLRLEIDAHLGATSTVKSSKPSTQQSVWCY